MLWKSKRKKGNLKLQYFEQNITFWFQILQNAKLSTNIFLYISCTNFRSKLLIKNSEYFIKVILWRRPHIFSFPGRLCETLRSAPTGPTWPYSTIQIFPPFYTFRLGLALLFKYSRHFTHSGWIWLYYSNIPAILRLQVGFGYSIQIFPPFYTFRLGLAL